MRRMWARNPGILNLLFAIDSGEVVRAMLQQRLLHMAAHSEASYAVVVGALCAMPGCELPTAQVLTGCRHEQQPAAHRPPSDSFDGFSHGHGIAHTPLSALVALRAQIAEHKARLRAVKLVADVLVCVACDG